MTPIESAFAKLPCTVCGTPRNVGCGCWVTLRCPECKREKTAQLDPTDPKGTASIRMLCPECAGGDFSLIDYFDKNGKQLLVP